jgi:hypothetical protein
MANPLDPILVWYKTAHDSLRVTRRVITQAIPGAITDKHVFHTKTPAECESALTQAQDELDRVVVLALTAIFERTIRDYLSTLPVIAAPTGNLHHDAVRGEILNDMEMWNISSRVIDLFDVVDPALRGQVKQIIKYRNWVAHGHTLTEPPPVNTNPADAHQRLTDFLAQAGVIVP